MEDEYILMFWVLPRRVMGSEKLERFEIGNINIHGNK